MKPTDLQINAYEIPSAGILLTGDLPVEWAAESVLPAYRAISPVSLKLEVQPIGDNVLVRGRCVVTLEFECSRTLETTTTRLETDVSELFVPGEKHHLKLDDGEEVSSEDLADEPWVIEDGKIDLESLVRESIVLAQDPYPVAANAPAPDETVTAPLWSSTLDGVDPRWERLKSIKLD
jgi:uncharacterized metal-binding protein YceD (DUF177 family)